jgi:3-hydroxybutyryl-CoA dehydrogenase
MLAVVADDIMKEEISAGGIVDESLRWVRNISELLPGTDCIDLNFDGSQERIHHLQQLSSLVVVNAVSIPRTTLPETFVRMNGWKGFLKRSMAEVSVEDPLIRESANSAFSLLGKKTEWVEDIPGFVSARVVSMIINEAYFALEENVSTRKEIDIAMKLGTNYPYGPFEWCEMIGKKNVHDLLVLLSNTNSRYRPAGLLVTEASML